MTRPRPASRSGKGRKARDPGPCGAAVPHLRVTVPGLYQQITVGKEMTYEVRVKNQGLAPVRQVVLAATVPNGMVLVPLSTGGPTKFTDENRVVRFEPTGEIGPGKTAIYRIRVRTKQPGIFHFGVDVNCPGARRNRFTPKRPRKSICRRIRVDAGVL